MKIHQDSSVLSIVFFILETLWNSVNGHRKHRRIEKTAEKNTTITIGWTAVVCVCITFNLRNWLLLRNISCIASIWTSLEYNFKKQFIDSYGPRREQRRNVVSHCVMSIRSSCIRIWYCAAPSTLHDNQNNIALANELDTILNAFHALFTNGDSDFWFDCTI